MTYHVDLVLDLVVTNLYSRWVQQENRIFFKKNYNRINLLNY